MKGQALLSEFRGRDLIADVTDEAELTAHLDAGTRTIYVGFDPTADSLHVGSLLPLLALRRVQLAGHRPIVLVGGGTGLIGDPSGKAGERALNPVEVVHEWAARLKRQVARFVDFEGPGAAILADNYDWLGSVDLVTFLRDIGKHFSVGAMLAREAVRARLASGISFTEFSYQVLQAYDFLCLLRRHDCTVQLGGSDQWGNITAGIELIRRIEGRAAYGLTLPLVTKSDGTKFGKTESGTVWLDARRTSPYEMYQFWLNTADADVVRFLRYFTFLPLAEIDDLTAATARAPEKREAQRVLAREVTRLVHGDAALRDAEEISGALFSGDVAALTEGQLEQAFAGVPCTAVDPPAALSATELLVRTGLAESKRRGRELISAGAVTLNGQRLGDPERQVSPADALYGRYVILRKGKKTYHVVTFGDGGAAEKRVTP
jgi:tyrosyl-tRNA synthetase